jgi:hypothetical protein
MKRREKGRERMREEKAVRKLEDSNKDNSLEFGKITKTLIRREEREKENEEKEEKEKERLKDGHAFMVEGEG